MATNNNTWIQTHTGLALDLIEPTPDMISILDIASGLAGKSRFSGQMRERYWFYTVAEHCILVSNHVPEEYAMWGLLHDAAEAYIGDIPRPARSLLTGFDEMEERIMRAVRTKFDMEGYMPREVKEVDDAALMSERSLLMAEPPKSWGDYLENDVVPLDIGKGDICLYSTKELASHAFLNRFYEILHARYE